MGYQDTTLMIPGITHNIHTTQHIIHKRNALGRPPDNTEGIYIRATGTLTTVNTG